MAEERSFLPEDLVEEILVRLPVKSIFKFESVSKRLYSLFRSKAFSDSYFGHHQVSIPTKKDLRLSYPDLRNRGRRRCRRRRSHMWATGPLSNGIYGLISILMKNDRYFFPHTLKIGLFNPATRQIKFAAPFPAEYLPRLTGISSHTIIVSCGIDDDYRVVVLIHYAINTYDNGTRDCYMFFLYTWRTGEWELLIDYNPGRRQIGLPPGTHVLEDMIMLMKDMTACSNKLLNGCWHWLTHHSDDEEKECHGIQMNVLSFDFERKSLGLIPGPRCKTSTRADVFVLQDQLAVIATPSYGPLLQIWMKMKDPETVWTNIFSVHPILESFLFAPSMLYGVDYYQVQEEPELIRIKSVKLLFLGSRLCTFDDKGGHQVVKKKQDFNQIPLSLAGISMFRPTLERLPDSSQFKVDYAKSLVELKSDSISKII